MNKLTEAFRYLTLLTLSGCGFAGPIQEIAPFSDQPDETFAFQYKSLSVSGAVWSFERDGRYVSFGGPVGFNYEGSREFVVSISGTGIDLSTGSDIVDTSPTLIEGLFDAADAYCDNSGFAVQHENGAGIHTSDGKLYLVGYCGPEA